MIGITSLGMDHTSLLGNSIGEIAWQKAGIMKPGSIAFTAPQKSSTALQVLKERAQNRRVNLNLYYFRSELIYLSGRYILNSFFLLL